MKRLTVLTMILIFSERGHSQVEHFKDSIEIAKRPLGGIEFYQHDKKLTGGQVLRVMNTNPAATAFFKKSRTQNVVSTLLGTVGGFLVGYELGAAIAGEKMN